MLIYLYKNMDNRLSPKTTWNPLFINLSHLANSFTSQHGEDGIIRAIFDHCPPQNKWCVEVGAADGRTISNIYSLIRKGWKAILIEKAYETLKDGLLFSGYRKILQNHNGNINVQCLNAELTRDNFDSLLSQYQECGLPKKFDFLSLDIDSFDAEVWSNLTVYRPNLICIECDESFTDLSVVSYDLNRPSGYNAASVGYLNQIAEIKGYDFVCAEVCNAFYIDKKFGEGLRV